MDAEQIKIWNVAASTPLKTVWPSDLDEKCQSASFVDMSFSPDGTRLAAVAGGEAEDSWFVAIWNVVNLDDMKPVCLWPCHNATRTLCYISTTSKITRCLDATEETEAIEGLLATSPGPESRITLWKEESGQVFQELEKIGKDIDGLAFCSQSKLLAGGSDDHEVRLWSVDPDDDKNKPEEKALRTFSGHDHFVTSVSFSPDGAYLASGSRDRTVKIWNVSDGDDQLVKTLTGHVHLILAVSFSPT